MGDDFMPVPNSEIAGSPIRGIYKQWLIINNQTFYPATPVTGPDMDLRDVKNIVCQYRVGAMTTTPTMTIKLQYKDPSGGYVDLQTSTPVATANAVGSIFTGTFNHGFGRIAISGTQAGNFANSYVVFEAKS